jgi:hypothetical protein
MSKVLFLDIDGVLHASHVGELVYTPSGPRVEGLGVCEHEPMLARLLEGFEVEVVVHSTWVRFGESFLTGYLPNLAARGRLHLCKRHIESRAGRVEDVVRRWRLKPDDFAILDDSVVEFGAYPMLRERLIACSRSAGISDGVAQKALLEFLRAA